MPNHPAEEMSEAEQFEEAIALNKKLKAMLDAASAKERAGGPGRGYSAGGPVRSASNRASSCGPRPVGGPPPPPRLHESDYSQRALAASRGPVMQNSNAINRRKKESQIAQENMGIAARIVGTRATRPKGQDQKLPPGWTRGIGGRLLPPPKQRWGQGASYDAGDWVS